jgi:hypothetical protein
MDEAPSCAEDQHGTAYNLINETQKIRGKTAMKAPVASG